MSEMPKPKLVRVRVEGGSYNSEEYTTTDDTYELLRWKRGDRKKLEVYHLVQHGKGLLLLFMGEQDAPIVRDGGSSDTPE